jgi:hypothetical protein
VEREGKERNPRTGIGCTLPCQDMVKVRGNNSAPYRELLPRQRTYSLSITPQLGRNAQLQIQNHMSLFGHIHQNKSCGYSSTRPAAIGEVCNGSGLGEVSMLCSRIAAGGFALLAASVANASAQSCLLPWGCEEPRLSGSVKPSARGASLTRKSFVPAAARSTPGFPDTIAATTGSERCRQNARWGEKGASVKGISATRERKQHVNRTNGSGCAV